MTKPIALVTGASAGLGAEFAQQLAKKGYNLILVARDKVRLEALAASLPEAECEVHPADLGDTAQRNALEQMLLSGTPLDLLVNNAGFGTFGKFYEIDIDKEEDEIRLNVLALVRLTRAALPGMVSRGSGAVLNVSSLAGLTPDPYNATYGATKAYVNSFTEAIHEELVGTGVRAMALCPGFTRTEFQARSNQDVSHIPSIAWMSSEQVVTAALHGLERGDVICVPGAGNKVAAAITGITPRSISRRVAGYLFRRA